MKLSLGEVETKQASNLFTFNFDDAGQCVLNPNEAHSRHLRNEALAKGYGLERFAWENRWVDSSGPEIGTDRCHDSELQGKYNLLCFPESKIIFNLGYRLPLCLL